MKLSIIIPTYNEEKYLPKLLESIERQEFKDYEIIVADANSKDKTVKIAKKYNCKIVKGGMQAVGRNNGAKAAKGELLLFLDSDVILCEHYLNDLLSQFEGVGIAITPLIPLSDRKMDRLMHYVANTYIKLSEKIRPHGSGKNILVRKAVHEKINGFDESMDMGEDTDYIVRAAKIAKFKVLAHPKIQISVRRLDKEGRLGLAWKYTKSTLYQLAGQKITAKELSYDYGHDERKKKVIYAVCGEGMGHAIRSSVIITHLLEKHDVLIVSSGRAFEYLSKKFPCVHNITGFNITYKDNEVKNTQTLINALKKLPKAIKNNLSMFYRLIRHFNPDIIISDFEAFSNIISKLMGVPLISIDNQHIMTKTKIDVPKKYMNERLVSVTVTKSFIQKPKNYLITTFFYPEIKNKKKAFLFPPILRKEILASRPTTGKHVLVYQTSESYSELIPVLRKINEKFVVYGLNKEEKDQNIQFRKFNEDIFLKEFASAKAVITNGGFTLIGEALHLSKPILSVPVKKQFEQTLNAIYVEKLGYGEFHKELDRQKIENFLARLDTYRQNLKKYLREDNSKILKKVDELIETHSKNHSPK